MAHGTLLRAGRSETEPVAGEAALDAFVEAAVDRSGELTAAREKLSAALGPPAVVEAAGVFATFQRMDRLADAAGLRADEVAAADLQPPVK